MSDMISMVAILMRTWRARGQRGRLPLPASLVEDEPGCPTLGPDWWESWGPDLALMRGEGGDYMEPHQALTEASVAATLVLYLDDPGNPFRGNPYGGSADYYVEELCGLTKSEGLSPALVALLVGCSIKLNRGRG